MASIRKRRDSGGKKTHQAQVRLNGYPAQTKTFASKTDAKRWAHQTEVDIRSGMFIRRTQATTHTVADLLDEYQKTARLTRKTGRDTDKAALAFWRKHPLNTSDGWGAEITVAPLTQPKSFWLSPEKTTSPNSWGVAIRHPDESLKLMIEWIEGNKEHQTHPSKAGVQGIAL